MMIPIFDNPIANDPVTQQPAARDTAAAQKVAQEFEALLLQQLTASLNPASDDEGSLFGNSGGGMDVYRQMLSEQLANAMSKAGGVGLADLMLSQARGLNPSRNLNNSALSKAIETARALRDSAPANPSVDRGSLVDSPRTTTTINPTRSTNLPEAELSGIFLPTRERTVASTSESALVATDDPRTLVRPRRVFPAPTEMKAAEDVRSVQPPRNPEIATRPPSRHVAHVALNMPVRGPVHSAFGPRIDPINHRPGVHRGIDISARLGTPIRSAAEGTVVFAGRQGGFGKTVLIEHADGRLTRYAHANQLMVSTGDQVRRGQKIATVGSTGRSTGPHLHFEVTENGRKVDPLKTLTNEKTLARR